jgi:hypothetical protein
MISAAGLDSFGDIEGRKEVLDLCPVHRFPDSPNNRAFVTSAVGDSGRAN